jgi:hypothetical protein
MGAPKNAKSIPLVVFDSKLLQSEVTLFDTRRHDFTFNRAWRERRAYQAARPASRINTMNQFLDHLA